MNILFLSLSQNIRPEDDTSIYSSVISELMKKGHNLYITSPLERRTKKSTFVEDYGNYKILHIKTGNITKTNMIEKGISTLLIQKHYTRAIKKYFQKIKFDLILYATPPISFCNTIKYFKNRDNSSTYLMLKDIFPQNAVDLKMFSKNNLIYKYFRKQEIKLYKLSDKIGCMSEKNKQYILDNNNYIDAKKVEIFPNSINPKEKNKRNELINIECRNKYKIPQDVKVFMYGGNLGKPQGVDFIIECFEKVKNIEGAYFIICGKGTEYKKIEDYKNNNCMNNLLLINGMQKNEYDNFLNIADIGLIFLDYKFTIPNFPSRLLSYLEKEIPILSCTDRNTDIGTIIEENNFGWKCYSNDSDKFYRLVKKIVEKDSKVLCKMGKNGKNYLLDNYNTSKNINLIVNGGMHK